MKDGMGNRDGTIPIPESELELELTLFYAR